MGLWGQKGVPSRGWDIVHIKDLGGDGILGGTFGNCEMCDKEHVRYLHVMEHDNYLDQVEVGCVCAERMCVGYDAKGAEKKYRNRAGRRARWLRRKWRWSRHGNQFVNVKGTNLVVFGKAKKWGWRLKHGRGEPSFSTEKLETAEAAKMALFEAFEEFLEANK